MIVTVGGSAASGKSTLAGALAERLGFNHVSAGQVMRDMAAEKGMSLVEFSKYAEEHPEVDREIDMRQKELAVGDSVVDGRLSRYFLEPDVSIWLTAPVDVRAERVLGRGEKYESVSAARKDIIERDSSERRRYLEFYDIDLDDLSQYDLVLNTGRFNIEQMTSLASAAVDSLRN
ncbi:MAG: AAA family ATPase [Candidatus Altiarchaeales archaeon]|nr:AAA family ATPase [Candidatus Altiarchaeales archaeon]MBD3416001.1 AAA family ATPase [Candidatus Altiarchaeales archaeon]